MIHGLKDGVRFTRALYLFRRDLRLADNTALNAALRSSDEIHCAFIFNPKQVEPHPYRSLPGLQFLIESLEELDRDLKAHNSYLNIFYGEPIDVIRELIANESINAVFLNRDYTPFSRARDKAIKELCDGLGVAFVYADDALLHDPLTLRSGAGTPYTVFTPFYKKASLVTPPTPTAKVEGSHAQRTLRGCGSLQEIRLQLIPNRNPKLFEHGGRKNGLRRLATIASYTAYDDNRNFPALERTTGLSPHNKFGTVSPREVYDTIASELGATHSLIREMYWRDFFYHVAWNFPQVFSSVFQSRFADLPWENDTSMFEKWCTGHTGFPIVDAGMRQLNETGFMHNRVRMIVASFLTKDLLIDWRWGERYFAQNLIDFDPSVNNGSWQWAASTGCDAQPYFRIFNPWLQQAKFDPQALYIKRWIPELSDLTAKVIHSLEDSAIKRGTYEHPVVEHAERRDMATAMYAHAAKKM